ncbi:MAG: 30S ribosomal protein S1 [Acidobacteriota bacterium]|nr:30S ribosomal protein S1 [Blastocatellia bacterium]MDW8411341.1 30S ribosomal protein S1 [Acidobacteriota bacterium]
MINNPNSVGTVAGSSGQKEVNTTRTNNTGNEDFGALLEDFESQSTITVGEIVLGRVIKISDRGVIIDIGFKSEGIAPVEEFLDFDGQIAVKPGEEVAVTVKQLDTPEGYVVLSRAEALHRQRWEFIEKAFNNKQTVVGRVIERIKGGLKVDLGGVTGFLPGSQVDVRPVRNLESFKGKDIEVQILKLNRRRSNVVLSRKAALEEQMAKRKASTLELLDDDVIVEGQVKNITDYGVFVDLGGIDGLLHITDIFWGRIQNPAEVFKIGETIQVKVLKFDREKERVSLGYKQLIPDPWDTVPERYPVGSKVKGKVVSITDYGAFVELEDGVEGLVHISEMTWSKRTKHPSKIVSVGQEVETMVLDIDKQQRRISLGLRQVLANPWDTIATRFPIGSRVHGRVRNLTDFGAFVEIEDGIDGLVHVSDISWTKRIKHPSEVLKKGQMVDAVVIAIDTANKRISLSIKELEPNAWDKFFRSHKIGDVVRGKIVRFANFGAFVELEGGIEGLCHISELSDQRVEKPEAVLQIGQELPFKILKLDEAQKKIGLSARAVARESDPGDISHYQNQDGVASLGEIAQFSTSSTSETENKK